MIYLIRPLWQLLGQIVRFALTIGFKIKDVIIWIGLLFGQDFSAFGWLVCLITEIWIVVLLIKASIALLRRSSEFLKAIRATPINRPTIRYHAFLPLCILPLFLFVGYILLDNVLFFNLFNIVLFGSLFLPLLLLTVLLYKRLLGVIYACYSAQLDADEMLEAKGASIFQGTLGAGKTSLACYIATLKQRQLWAELQMKYKLMFALERQWKAERNEAKLIEWYEVKSAYKFYMKHPNIAPCIASTVPLWIGNKKVQRFTVGHMLQEKRLAAYTVVIVDELSKFVDKWLCKVQGVPEKVALEEFFRFFRQFFGNKARLIATEQDSGNALIDIRRVVASNEYMIKQTWVYKAHFLNWLMKRLKKRMTKFRDYVPRYWREKYLKLKGHIESIGFREYDFVNIGNLIEKHVPDERRQFLVPSRLNCFYDDRAYRKLYQKTKAHIEFFEHKSQFVEPDVDVLLYAPSPTNTKKELAKEVQKKD